MTDASQNFGFHRVVARWFAARFGEPTDAQRLGWPQIAAGHDTLIAAPTGSGKTLAAFLVCIDRLLRDAVTGTLADETRVLYVSPLKALASDIRKNLEGPLAEIQAAAEQEGLRMPGLRALTRSGDTPASQRAAMLKRPPHILVTTPESLYLLLTGERGRQLLRTVETVIIDEIHAVARDKRGSHLALSLERLTALTAKKPQRIGLSATQKPIGEIAAFLVGTAAAGAAGDARCAVVDTGHQRRLDLAVEVPPSPLGTVCANEQWEEIYHRIGELVGQHRSTLIFVNTRKLAERVGFHLAALLGDDVVASHHGSLSRERRLAAEEKLKAGQLKVIVATASLELGIDIGAIDLVLQLGSPRSIATFLQRVGRAGHSVGAVPKGRLFAFTRDELLEALALVKAVRAGTLDKIVMPQAPLDILSQQVVAEACAHDCNEDELFALMRGAYPYRDLARGDFDAVVTMLAGGYASGRRKGAFLHRDGIAGTLKARRGARLAAVTSGGAIPEQGDFRVISDDDGSFVGTINEDFALESSKGDVFLLGNTSWAVVGLRGTEMRVRDAHGAPPTIPFWLGEAPGRTVELSSAVAALREGLEERIALPTDPDDPLTQLDSLLELAKLDPIGYRSARAWLAETCGADAWVSLQVVHYVAAQKAALGVVPSQKRVVFERFFDDTGGMQLVIHAPFGIRINKGWGLALRKCFCRSFDFELQASADNDGIVLSLGPQHSFPIEQLFRFLTEQNVTALLEQAVLAVPLFQIRWRWNATRSLAVLRAKGGQRVPPALQRFRADDLMTAVFPAQTMCKEHLTGDIEIPDHPLVKQTMHDCLHEAIDHAGLVDVLRRIASGDIELIARDTREPSPFAYQLLNAYPYAFLDGAPLEERRARAVATRRSFGLADLTDLSRLAPEAAAQVAREAWPTPRDPDELHDVLSAAGVLAGGPAVAAGWEPLMAALVAAGRAARLTVAAPDGSVTLWFAAECLDLVTAAYDSPPSAAIVPALALPARLRRDWTAEDARLTVLRGWLELRGVAAAATLAAELGLRPGDVAATLPVLELRGEAVRGRFLHDGDAEWCERRLLMRIHRLTLDGLRRQIKPVPPDALLRYLARHQRLTPSRRGSGRAGLLEVVRLLAGFDAGAGAWESELLASRMDGYEHVWLDELTHSGLVTWGRLRPPHHDEDAAGATGGMTRVVPLALFERADAAWLAPAAGRGEAEDAERLAGARGNAQTVYAALAYGAQFFAELAVRTALLPTQLEEALGELCRLGLVNADGFAAIRPFVSRSKKAQARSRPGLAARFHAAPSYALGGRWSRFPGLTPPVLPEQRLTNWARLLLTRYGVVFRDLLTRESAAPTWGELARVYRQLEARGEIRGGRFVAGPYGEQFALPEAVERLRLARDEDGQGEWVVISAADPLNLVGIVTPGERVASNRSTLLILADGRHVATKEGTEVTFHAPQPAATEQAMRHALQLSGRFRTRATATTLALPMFGAASPVVSIAPSPLRALPAP